MDPGVRLSSEGVALQVALPGEVVGAQFLVLAAAEDRELVGGGVERLVLLERGDLVLIEYALGA